MATKNKNCSSTSKKDYAKNMALELEKAFPSTKNEQPLNKTLTHNKDVQTSDHNSSLTVQVDRETEAIIERIISSLSDSIMEVINTNIVGYQGQNNSYEADFNKLVRRMDEIIEKIDSISKSISEIQEKIKE